VAQLWEEGRISPRGKLNVKTGLPLNLYFGFQYDVAFVCVSDYFPVI